MIEIDSVTQLWSIAVRARPSVVFSLFEAKTSESNPYRLFITFKLASTYVQFLTDKV